MSKSTQNTMSSSDVFALEKQYQTELLRLQKVSAKVPAPLQSQKDPLKSSRTDTHDAKVNVNKLPSQAVIDSPVKGVSLSKPTRARAYDRYANFNPDISQSYSKDNTPKQPAPKPNPINSNNTQKDQVANEDHGHYERDDYDDHSDHSDHDYEDHDDHDDYQEIHNCRGCGGRLNGPGFGSCCEGYGTYG